MTASPFATYLPVLMMVVAAFSLAAVMYFAHSFLATKKKGGQTAEQLLPFECGSETTGAKDIKPSVKFYVTAILFVVFDIEAVFIYPWATHFRALGVNGFLTMLAFLAALGVALVYVWRKGALDWEK